MAVSGPPGPVIVESQRYGCFRPKADIAQLWQEVLQFSPIGNVGCSSMPARYAQTDP
jgi:hypothetical protein